MKEEKNTDHEFKKGNQLWRNVDPENIGRKPKFENASALWNNALKYFDYCDNNPIEVIETKKTKNGRQNQK